MTVSRVLNSPELVRASTRSKVERAIAELAFQPSMSARTLRNGRTNTLRLLFDAQSDKFLSNPFQDAIVAGAVDTAHEYGFAILIDIARAHADAPHYESFDNRRIDGTIIVDSTQPSVIADRVILGSKPAVVLANQLAVPGLGWVDADFYDGAFVLTSHLLESGHKHIGFLTDRFSLHSTKERRRGYIEALNAFDVEFDESLVEFAGQYRQGGYDAAGRLLARKPTLDALFCINDLTAMGAIAYSRSIGKDVPGDISVTGYDDILIAQDSVPALTTARIPWYEMTEAAVGALVAAIVEGKPVQVQHVFPVDVILRASA